MQPEEQAGRQRKVIFVVAVVALCCVAVVTPVIVLAWKPGAKSHGEDIDELAELVKDEIVLDHQSSSNIFRADDEMLLSDLYDSSNALEYSSLGETNPPTANSTNSTLLNVSSTLSPTIVETEPPTLINSDEQTTSPTGSPTTSPSESPSDTPTKPPTDTPTASPTKTTVSQPQIVKSVDSYQVLEILSHDTNAFTQGLTFDPENGDIVYESTGIYGESDVRKVDMSTGDVLAIKPTPREIFGEGLAYYTEATEDNPSAGRLIHITWKSRRGFIFDAETLEPIQEFQYSTQRNQGWGITYNPNTDQFIVTDGSKFLHFWDRDLNEVARIPVTILASENADPTPVNNLNEIEWDDETQTVLSNVWQTDNIVRIDPVTGSVVTIYDLSQLYTNRAWDSDVLNGIAISPSKDLWVTGKWWPNMYRIVFDE